MSCFEADLEDACVIAVSGRLYVCDLAALAVLLTVVFGDDFGALVFLDKDVGFGGDLPKFVQGHNLSFLRGLAAPPGVGC